MVDQHAASDITGQADENVADPVIAVVGAGRVGQALIAALDGAHGPFPRGFDGTIDPATTGPRLAEPGVAGRTGVSSFGPRLADIVIL
ncbi:MAG TPA: hypothetical protein PLV68_19685, partial [Ilumatobacteraceae bacterium]|nr:hypothetical protein [Ilumatobacteraceae bacterium]